MGSHSVRRLVAPNGVTAPWMTLAVIGVALAACVAGIMNTFTQDDIELIQESARLHDLSQWKQIIAGPYWPPPYPADLYRPITLFLLALQYVTGSGTPVVFRLVSIALYAIASAGVFQLGSRLLPPAIALIAALLFAAHPVHVEALVLAVAQSEIIIALLTTLAVVRYLDRRRAGDGSLRSADWLLLGGAYAIAALTKEQGFFLPGFLLLAETLLVVPAQKDARVRSLWKGFAFLAAVGLGILVVRASVLGFPVVRPAPAETLVNSTVAGRIVTAFQIVPQWLRLLVWPAHLRADYSPQEFVASTSFGAQEALGLLIVVAAAVVVAFNRVRVPVLAFGLCWCALALFPVSNLVVPTGVLIAERTLFLPSIGIVLAIGGAASHLLERSSSGGGRRITERALLLACGALVVAGGVRSAVRQRDYRDTKTLSLVSVNDSPRSWRVHQAYGEAMFDLGRTADGTRAYRTAIDLAPSPWWVRNSLARRLRLIGDDAGALIELRMSLGQYPRQTDALPEIAAALLALGRYEEARRFADDVIAVSGTQPIMVWLRHVADSALAVQAPPGSVRIGIQTP